MDWWMASVFIIVLYLRRKYWQDERVEYRGGSSPLDSTILKQ